VLIWDGDPAAGGRLIADKMLTGVDVNGDSCTWLQDFRFAEAGDHILHAQVSEAQSDALLGNATDILEVTVASIPTIAPYLAEGLATNVGETGEFTLSGRFRYDGDLNLAASKLVIASVLDEIDGAGELIPGVGEQTGQELVLQPHFSLENRAVYRTPRGQLPRVSAVLSVHQARLGLSLRVSDAEIRKPFLCGHRTELTTALVVLDGEKAPLNLAMTEPWICERRFNDNGGTLRLNQSWR
jgi:hypothetical protein